MSFPSSGVGVENLGAAYYIAFAANGARARNGIKCMIEQHNNVCEKYNVCERAKSTIVERECTKEYVL